MTERTIFGEDLGMGANKLYGPQGGLSIPSIVSINNEQTINIGLGFRSRKPPMSIKVNGMSLYVGEDAHDWGRAIENLAYERMSGIPETRAIFYASLTQYFEKYGYPTSPITIIAGLPLEPLTGPQAHNNASGVKRWIEGHHEWEADGKTYHMEVISANVASQPTGALYDYVLDAEGKPLDEPYSHFTKEMGILSVGFNTIEILTVNDRKVVQGLSNGKTSGVRRLLELVNKEGHYSLGELDGMLRAGKLDVRSALPVWASEVNGQIEKTWGRRWKRFSAIIVVGGGAILLGDALREGFNGKLFIPEDPVISISRGLYKMAISPLFKRG